MKNENSRKMMYRIIKILLMVLSLGSMIFGAGLLLSVPLREFVIVFAENNIVHRQIDHEIWHTLLAKQAVLFFIVAVLSAVVCVGKTLERIADILCGLIVEVKKISIPKSVLLLAFFLFCYVWLNINIMPLVICWIIYKLGFLNWLDKTFGKKETKTALVVSGIAVVFFIVIMFAFKVTIVMSMLWGDSNRVFGDFTQISANHYRIKVHPFYVLIWQSLYHLLCPSLVIKTSIALRIMVSVFAGLNIGVFSLFVSRLTKSRLLNSIMCAIMTFSFPQIYHGAQMLESFIFTQTSVLLMMLYFSFAFSKRDYNTRILLALSLFVAGNNIAYFCLFGIFYLVLLYQTSESWKAAWNKIWAFSVWFIVVFSVLLLIQTVFYGLTAPSNIFSMLREIVSEEGRYITKQPVSLSQYAENFFGAVLFPVLPFGIGAIFKYGWVWAFLLLAAVIGFKKNAYKPLFAATCAGCVFLFIFHRFYGIAELPLYSPVIMCVYLSMLAFITQSPLKKIAAVFCGALLAVLIIVNSLGMYAAHCINQYVFGINDIVNYLEYEIPANKLKERIADYSGNPLFIFKALNETETLPRSPLHNEILRSYQNNDIDIVTLPPSEANRAPVMFFFGLENRRKLVFERDALKDFKTGEILFSFPNAEIAICPWDYSIRITTPPRVTLS
jgi:hypothetical protein